MITININYYNNMKLFRLVRDYYTNLPKNNNVQISLCDDGSNDEPLYEVPDEWRVYRIKEDLGWNAQGARNLLMQETETYWNINIDLDKVITPLGWKLLQNDNFVDRLNPYEIHMLMRCPEFNRRTQNKRHGITVNTVYPLCANDYFITKECFWNLGGYDELSRGYYYGGDSTLLNNAAKRCLSEFPPVIEMASEVVEKKRINKNESFEFVQSDERICFDWERIQ